MICSFCHEEYDLCGDCGEVIKKDFLGTVLHKGPDTHKNKNCVKLIESIEAKQ